MKSEPDNYRHLLENLPDAFAYHQIVTDNEGIPVDYIFLEINGAFEEMTGLKREKVIGRKVTEVLPGITKGEFDWIAVYGRVALTGEPTRFESFSETLGRWYDVSAYSDKTGYFATVFRDITEQKRIETETLENKRNLEETTQRLESILSLTGTGFDIIDAHYNLHYVDHLWQKVYGNPAGRKCYEYFKDRNSPCETCGIPRALATKQVVLSEQVLPKENNRIVEVHTTPFQNPQGEWLVAEFKIDITERKQVEQALKESETRFRSYIDNAPYGVFVHNEKGEILEANKTACLMSGYSEEELLGMNLSQLIPQTDRQRSRDQFRVITEQGSVSFELPHTHKDGTLRVWSVNAVKLSDTRFLGFTQDITEKRQAEEALKESEMHSQALVGAIPDMLFRYSREGVYLEAVVKEEELLYTKARSIYLQSKLVGKKIAEVLPATIAEKLMAGIEKALESGEIQVLEYSYQTNDLECYFEARLAPIGNAEVVSIVRDVTERKSYEDKLQYLSFHDELTGVYNRRYYENELKRLNGSREHPIAIISADLDGLKLVNDSFGHGEGDRYIQIGAELLKNTLRASDILARLGGDEFAIILPRMTGEQGQKLLERIEHQIEEYNRTQRTDLPLSISIGLAVSESSEHSLEETYKKADRAMYTDKLQRSRKARNMIITLLLDSLHKRSDLSDGEREQVEEISLRMGRELKLDSSKISDLKLLSRAYDLGKVSLPDHIVHCNLRHKSGELTETEREAVRRHPEAGYRIALSSPELADIAELILKHHENFDGSGYPLGLEGEKIPVECRIVAIAIAYTAMTNPRPYAKTLDRDEAIEELKRCSGAQFDPELVKVFAAVMADEGR